MAELHRPRFDRAMLEMGPTQLNIPRDYFYGEIDCEIPQPLAIERGAGGEKSLDEAAALLAKAKFPVILAGGGVVMGDASRRCKALAELLARRSCNSYLHNDSFPREPPAVVRPARLSGLEGGDEADRQGRRRAGARHAARARSARCRSTASTTGRRTRRSSRSTPTTRCSGWSSRSPSASAATRRRPRAALVAAARQARRSPATPTRDERAAADRRPRRTRGRSELDEWTHEKRSVSST